MPLLLSAMYSGLIVRLFPYGGVIGLFHRSVTQFCLYDFLGSFINFYITDCITQGSLAKQKPIGYRYERVFIMGIGSGSAIWRTRIAGDIISSKDLRSRGVEGVSFSPQLKTLRTCRLLAFISWSP